ncbi:hypothetical protein D5086_013502 [Populus alba]|uniref:Uncharacterized protein n=1 Tax=Populus alba TaxID=43335 RepID=A0ACC4C5M9_POPAL
MPRQKGSATMEELLPGKIRKRVCSSSASSSSSIIQNYRFKRAILVGKRGGSSTPVPTWKLMGKRTPSSTLRALESSPKSLNGKAKQQQAPVSARKLAATLWEMNEMPSPQMKEEMVEERRLRKEGRGRERRPVHSGSLPPHLSDPSHSPVSERIDRSGTGSCHRRTSSISQKLRLMDQSIGAFDSVSNVSLMEIETRSRAQTPSGSTVGVKPRLKDVSNALTTSKELLKIINRVWGNEDRPSSSMSLISALHAELERARLQVNHFIQEQCSDQNEINYLMKCFAEEKAAWKNKEQKVVEAAIESIAGELDVEKKLRRRFESLNKKLGKELAETKASLLKAVKELESEKRARVVMQQVCDELARDIGDDKAEVEELKRESAKLCEEVEKEREMMHEINEEDGEVDDGVICEEGSAESDLDLHSIELNMDNNNKSYKWTTYPSGTPRDVRKAAIDEEDIKGRKSTSSKLPRRSTSLQRSISDGVEWDTRNERVPLAGDVIDWGRFSGLERQGQGKVYGDEMHGHQSMKGLRDYLLSGSRLDSPRGYASPMRQAGQLRSSLDPSNLAQERPPVIPGNVSKSRLSEAKAEGMNLRKSKW